MIHSTSRVFPKIYCERSLEKARSPSHRVRGRAFRNKGSSQLVLHLTFFVSSVCLLINARVTLFVATVKSSLPADCPAQLLFQNGRKQRKGGQCARVKLFEMSHRDIFHIETRRADGSSRDRNNFSRFHKSAKKGSNCVKQAIETPPIQFFSSHFTTLTT